MADFKFEITKEIGVISKSKSGWTKEVNLVSWGDKEPRYDIRDWAPDHQKPGKGICLTHEEFESLKEILEKA